MIDTSIITFFLFYCNSCLFGSYGFLLALTDPDILFSTKAKMCPTQGSKTSVVKTPPYVTVLQHKHKPQKQSCGKSCDFFCIILIMDLPVGSAHVHYRLIWYDGSIAFFAFQFYLE